MKTPISASLIATIAFLASATGAAAKEEAPAVTLTKCDRSYGTIAIVEGDTQGWTKYGLGSPRELINALALESGCFTPHNPATGGAANFLMNVIAGDKEEVDKGIEMAKGAAVEGLVRSGAASRLLGRTPFGGSALGMLGGLGGKKKTVAAGIRLINPASGQTLVSGTGDVTKSSITFAGIGGGLQQGASAAGYGGSKDGEMLVEAFIKAFNAVAAQGAALPPPVAAPAAAAAGAVTAVDTRMYATPNRAGTVVRSLRTGAALKPTGKREGLFLEVDDGFGTKGWVSVEDLK